MQNILYAVSKSMDSDKTGQPVVTVELKPRQPFLHRRAEGAVSPSIQSLDSKESYSIIGWLDHAVLSSYSPMVGNWSTKSIIEEHGYGMGVRLKFS